jgi:uncharacterized protein YdeI (YjbR/CyaY-like superfamily)
MVNDLRKSGFANSLPHNNKRVRFDTVSRRACPRFRGYNERLMMSATKLPAKTFDAVLERTGDRLNWTIIRVPFDVAKLWGVRGQLRVKGEMNGFPFRTSLFPTGNGTHMMMVNKKMQAGGKAAPGSKAHFRLEPDAEKREIQQPPELARALRQSKPLLKYYEALSYSMRHEIAKWIAAAKHTETRQRRGEEMAERLMLTMEAEQEVPPVLQAALRSNPLAQRGWELMPRGHKRHHLLAIFYYKTPEARARRIAKAMAEMVRYAEKEADSPKKKAKAAD